MIKNKRVLAVIPARGGSKRLPRKNVLDLAGKPLIAWTIEAGLRSRYVDSVVVSSDDNEILKISRQFGASVIHRPDILASDTATSFDVIKHSIDNVGGEYDYIVLLQPTSPFRNEKHIDEAIELLVSKNAEAVIAVCEVEHSPLWSNTLGNELSMEGFLPEVDSSKRSQDLEAYYRLNGAIYICERNKLLGQKTFFLKHNIYAYIMERESSIDIDEEIDFQFSSFMMKRIKT